MTARLQAARRPLAYSCATLVLAVSFAGPALAQRSPATASATSSFTLGDVIARLQAGAAIVGLSTTNPPVSKTLDSLGRVLSDEHATGLSLDQVADLFTRRSPKIGTVARWNRDPCAPTATACFYGELVDLLRIAHGSLEQALHERLSKDSLNVLYAPVDQLGTVVLQRAGADNQEKLRRYGVKYGANSPQLNVAEVGLNYLAQLAVPGFLPSADGWPSPFEIVADYRPWDLTAAQSASAHLTARAVATTLAGLRVYNFGASCGGGGVLADLLHPCESSGGAFLLAPQDQPLSRTWGPDMRLGAYFSRGKYHVGFVFGPNPRIALGIGTQLLPYIF